MTKELPKCSVDTLLEKKACLSEFKEGVEYNLEEFPYFLSRLKGVVLHTKNENIKKEKELGEVEGDNIDTSVKRSFLNMQIETNKKLISNYNIIINNGSFTVIGFDYKNNVTSNSLISSSVITIKSGEIEFNVSSNILKRVK